MATVLVTDGTERSALAVVRSLGRAGHRVLVAAARPRSLAAASRWCAGEFVLPDPLRTPETYATRLAATVAERKVEVLIPVTDASVLAVLAHRASFGAVCIPFADLDSFVRLSDKGAAAAAAQALGIRVPRQARADTPGAQVDLSALEPPFVVKPAHSVAGDAITRAKHPVVHAADVAEARDVLARLPATAFPALVQERITGAGIGVFMLVWNGALLAAFAHRRLREKPPAGGVSVYAESIAVDDAVLARSRRLLEHFGWNGVAMVEYKLDGATGEPVLMEINGRFWGSLQLAIDAGVDFPRLLVDAALGRPVTPVTSWRAGVRGRWFWGDVDHGLTRLRRSDRALHLAPDAPGRLSTLAALAAATLRFTPDQVFRLADPAPALRELGDRITGRG